jgi:hypothetical protein
MILPRLAIQIGVALRCRPHALPPSKLGRSRKWLDLAEIEDFLRRVFPKTSRCFLSLECSLADGPISTRPQTPLATFLGGLFPGSNKPSQGPLGQVQRPTRLDILATTPPTELVKIIICAN